METKVDRPATAGPSESVPPQDDMGTWDSYKTKIEKEPLGVEKRIKGSNKVLSRWLFKKYKPVATHGYLASSDKALLCVSHS
jgi:hypothetical protein